MLTDPQGEQFVMYERIGDEQQEFDEDNFASYWRQMSF